MMLGSLLRNTAFALVLVLFLSSSIGHSEGSVAYPSSSNVLVTQVNGIVCSFCAHGLEKALSKLDGLDASQYGNGVLVDIESQLVTLAFAQPTEFPFEEVHRRIVKAGYDPVQFNFRVSGLLERVNDAWRIKPSKTSTTYQLVGLPEGEEHVEGQAVDWNVSLDAKQAKTFMSGQALQVQFDAKP